MSLEGMTGYGLRVREFFLIQVVAMNGSQQTGLWLEFRAQLRESSPRS
jgi:hypothetical protein